MMSSILLRLTSAGFSMIKCLSASRASIATSARPPGGVQMTTTSISVAAMASVNELNAWPPCTVVIFSAFLQRAIYYRDKIDLICQVADHLGVMVGDHPGAHQRKPE